MFVLLLVRHMWIVSLHFVRMRLQTYTVCKRVMNDVGAAPDEPRGELPHVDHFH